MEKGRPLLRWAGILLVFAAVSFMGNEVRGDAGPVKTPEPGRSDRLTIDTLAAFQKLELPPVTFFHDKHTDALLKEKKGCETCPRRQAAPPAPSRLRNALRFMNTLLF